MRKNHAIDLKIKAVLKASLPSITAGEVAEEIGVHTFSLYRWKKELRDAGLLNKTLKEKDFDTDLEFEEKLSQLQKENERFRIESAVLKSSKDMAKPKKEALK
ncbi:transposase [Candidatus Vondammii sp. HM_W22]|uniref:transposase n=1 Tax=Candidatus Vondammii sp. HM_W22 TaxID=2687299 RepID=UPI001F13AADE|nr:transposase [Candidatus Vondammii sp. HM_W22]